MSSSGRGGQEDLPCHVAVVWLKGKNEHKSSREHPASDCCCDPPSPLLEKSSTLLGKNHVFYVGPARGTDATRSQEKCISFLMLGKQSEGRTPSGGVGGPGRTSGQLSTQAPWPAARVPCSRLVQVQGGLFIKHAGLPAASCSPAITGVGKAQLKILLTWV